MAKVFKLNDAIKVAPLTEDFKILSKQLSDVEKRFDGVIRASKQINDSIQKQTATRTNTNKAITQTNKNIKDLTTVEKESLKLREQTTRLIVKTRAEREKEGRRLAKVKTLRQQHNKVIKNEILLKQGATKQGKKLNETLRRQNQELKKMRGTSGGLTKSLGVLAAGYIGVSTAIRVVSNGVRDFIKTNREFESSMANVLTLLTEADKKEFGDVLKKGSIDIVSDFGLEIKDVNKAMFDAISAGIPAAEAIDFLRKNAELAIGGVTDLTTAVDGVTSVVNAYGLQASEVDEVTSAFFTAQKFGKTTVEELSASIGKTAPIAKQAGVGYRELLATFAELTKQGISTEESATAIKSTLIALIKPTVDAKASFDKLGISTGAAAIKEKGFLNVLKQVSVAAETNEDTLAELIPNVRALTGVGALGSEQLAELDSILLELNTDFGEGSSLMSAFNEQMETSEAQSARLKGEWQKLLITLGGGESIFKKIGSGLRQSLTREIEMVTAKIELFKEAWNRVFKKDIPEATKEGVEETTAIITEETEKRNQEVAQKEKELEEIRRKVSERENDKLKAEAKKREAARKREAAAREAAIKKQVSDEIKALELISDKSINELKDRLLKKEITQEEFNNQIIALQLKLLEKELEISNLSAEQKVAIEEKLLDQKIAIRDKELELVKTTEEKKREEADKTAQREQEIREEKLAASIEMGNALFELGTSLRDRELVEIDAQEAAKLALAGDNEEAKAKIEKEFDTKRKVIQRKQAISDKAQGLFNAGINTAKGITAALGLGVIGIPLAILIGVLGAVQIAAIAAKPIPKLAKGVKGFKGGMAEYGEAGQEIVSLPSGDSFLAENKTIGYLPPGTDIIPNYETEKILSEHGGVTGEKFNELISEVRKGNNQPTHSTNVTQRGFEYYSNYGNTRIKWINKYLNR